MSCASSWPVGARKGPGALWRPGPSRIGPERRPDHAQAILLLAVCVRLLVSKQLQPVRLIFDRNFKNEIAMHERAMNDSVERVRRIPGDVQCSTLVSYRAGKPFAVDRFNVEQRIVAGALPQDVVAARVASGSLTIVEDPRTQRSP